jgi:hypothetical protein
VKLEVLLSWKIRLVRPSASLAAEPLGEARGEGRALRPDGNCYDNEDRDSIVIDRLLKIHQCTPIINIIIIIVHI